MALQDAANEVQLAFNPSRGGYHRTWKFNGKNFRNLWALLCHHWVSRVPHS